MSKVVAFDVIETFAISHRWTDTFAASLATKPPGNSGSGRMLQIAMTMTITGMYEDFSKAADAALTMTFPHVLTHLALINSAVNLELYARRGANGLRGSYAERARYTVEATAGMRACWAAFRKSHRAGRLRSSHESMMTEQ